MNNVELMRKILNEMNPERFSEDEYDNEDDYSFMPSFEGGVVEKVSGIIETIMGEDEFMDMVSHANIDLEEAKSMLLKPEVQAQIGKTVVDEVIGLIEAGHHDDEEY